MFRVPFHPAVSAWFEATFAAPTDAQRQAWGTIGEHRHTLIAAPTGSGKTLAAFLAAIDTLVREGIERGLSNATQVVYISPLKALSNDIQKDLQQPLQGIRQQLVKQGLPEIYVSALVRMLADGFSTRRGRRSAYRATPGSPE